MIRGALILAVGFGLGYGKAMSEQDAISEVVGHVKRFLDDIAAADKQEKPETVDSTVEGEGDPS